MEPIGFATIFNNKVFKTSPIPPGAALPVAASGRVKVTGNKKLAITATTAAAKVPTK